MSNPPGSILHFSKYVFLDNNEVRNHFALLLIPEDKSDFVNNIWCSVISSKQEWKTGMKKYSVALQGQYSCFSKNTYVHTHKIDIQEIKHMSKKNPRAALTGSDAKNVFRKLQSYIYHPKSTMSPEIRATISREWMRHYYAQW